MYTCRWHCQHSFSFFLIKNKYTLCGLVNVRLRQIKGLFVWEIVNSLEETLNFCSLMLSECQKQHHKEMHGSAPP